MQRNCGRQGWERSISSDNSAHFGTSKSISSPSATKLILLSSGCHWKEYPDGPHGTQPKHIKPLPSLLLTHTEYSQIFFVNVTNGKVPDRPGFGNPTVRPTSHRIRFPLGDRLAPET